MFVARLLREHAVEADGQIAQVVHRVIPERSAVSAPALVFARHEETDESEGRVTDGRDASDRFALELRGEETLVVCGIERSGIV